MNTNIAQGIRTKQYYALGGIAAGLLLSGYIAYQVSGNNSDSQANTTQTEQNDSLETVISDGKGNNLRIDFGSGVFHKEVDVEVHQTVIDQNTYLLDVDKVASYLGGVADSTTETVKEESRGFIDSAKDFYEWLRCFECPPSYQQTPVQKTPVQKTPSNNYSSKPSGSKPVQTTPTVPTTSEAPKYIPPLPENVQVKQDTYVVGGLTPNVCTK